MSRALLQERFVLGRVVVCAGDGLWDLQSIPWRNTNFLVFQSSYLYMCMRSDRR